MTGAEEKNDMATEAQSLSKPTGPPKRHVRNYLLEPRFQLKYTGMVVGVTLVVASVLGFFAYRYSHGQTEMLTARSLAESGMDLPPETVALIEEEAAKADRQVLLSIIGGIALLAFALGVTGIVVTHRLVGPAYKLKLLLRDVTEGHLRVKGRLRKGDELQDVFFAFEAMVEEMRRRQSAEVAGLTSAIEKARAAGMSEDVLVEFERIRDQMKAELD
jgi:methyl-accepting chemotaxis protein